MPPSEIRKDAKIALSGKWKKGVCILLAYLLISFAYGFISGLFESNKIISCIIEIAWLVFSIPFTFGIAFSYLKLKRNEEVGAFDFLKKCISIFKKSWAISLRVTLKLLLPILCLIILIALFAVIIFFILSTGNTFNYFFGTIIALLLVACLVYAYSRSLLYSLVYFIAYDNPTMSSKECVLESEKLMTGNRGNLFILMLSFIGWILLACITLGIGLLWVLPYMYVAEVCFYDRILEKKSENTKILKNNIYK